MKSLFSRLTTSISLLFMLPAIAAAANVEGNNKSIKFSQLPKNFTQIQILGPEGRLIELTSNTYNTDQELPNGAYQYKVLGEVKITPKVDHYKASLNNGRDSKQTPKKQGNGIVESGHFHIQEKKVKQIKDTKE